jgi:hypothetical protein
MIPTFDQMAGALQAHGLDVVDCRRLLPRHATKRYRRRTSAPSGVVFHHSAGISSSDGLSRVRAVARYTVEQRKCRDGSIGWPGVPYDAIVDPLGVVYLTGGLDLARYHAGYRGRPGDENDELMSVCLLGSFAGPHNDSTSEPSLPQMTSTLGTILALRALFPGWAEEENRGFWTHSDLGKAACPGETIQRMIHAARASR